MRKQSGVCLSLLMMEAAGRFHSMQRKKRIKGQWPYRTCSDIAASKSKFEFYNDSVRKCMFKEDMEQLFILYEVRYIRHININVGLQS